MADSADVAARKQCPHREYCTQHIQHSGEDEGMNNLVLGLFYHAYEVALSFHTQAIIHSINGQILDVFFFSFFFLPTVP